jgi:molybdate transport system substrate-binding protein
MRSCFAEVLGSVHDGEGEALRVLAAGAVKAVMHDLFHGFRLGSGSRLDMVFDTVGALRDRVLAGERPDILIVSAPAMQPLTAKGIVDQVRLMDLGRTGVALAGRKGRGQADLDTAGRFKEVLLAAERIGYADPARGATAGTQFVKCLGHLGLEETLRARLKVYPFGVEAISALGRGELDIAVSQATEILPQPDVSFLGMFPEECQVWTAYQAVALSDRPGAQEFMGVLAGPAGSAALQRVGFF